MFPLVDFTGKPLDARLRRDSGRAGSRLYEVTQIKGDGEAHHFLSPNDEFAGFERWDKGNLDLTELKKPEMLQYEYARSGARARAEARTGTRRQPVQVRHDRLDRLAHLAGDRRPGQFLRQAQRRRAEPDARYPSLSRLARRQREDHGVGAGRLGLRRGVGHRKHPRGDLRRAGTQGGVCHHRPADDRALLRRLRFRARRRENSQPRCGRLCQRRADGRRSRPRRRRARHPVSW